jgi:PAS domain-containing protein
MSLVCTRDGTPYGVRGVARDITRRKQVEEQLRRSEERYRELVDNANDIVYTIDMEGRYTSLNRAGERISGYTREEIAGMSWKQIIAPEYVSLVSEMLLRKVGRPAIRDVLRGGDNRQKRAAHPARSQQPDHLRGRAADGRAGHRARHHGAQARRVFAARAFRARGREREDAQPRPTLGGRRAQLQQRARRRARPHATALCAP